LDCKRQFQQIQSWVFQHHSKKYYVSTIIHTRTCFILMVHKISTRNEFYNKMDEWNGSTLGCKYSWYWRYISLQQQHCNRILL
jgi:hypothetical protein